MAQHLTQRQADDSRNKRRKGIIATIIVIALMIVACTAAGRYLSSRFGNVQLIPPAPVSQKPVTATYDPSPVDFNGNGVDDYGDIVAGARKDAEAKPQYDDGYYQGGYPPDNRGACTDLVWRAFREAGYDLKAMVDADIAADSASYTSVAPNPDPNIDFRRTGVLDVFFSKYGQTLTTDTADAKAWQAGDIVVFEHTRHIGVISDKRDNASLPYVLHNMGQNQRENDYFAFKRHMTVTGHYRFDASKVPQDVLKAWQQ